MTTTVSYSFTQSADPGVRWFVSGVSVREGLNEPYEISCEIVTAAEAMDPDDLLGCDVRVVIERPSISRAFCGIVKRVEKGFAPRAAQTGAPRTVARIWAVPALEALKHTKDTRIFQEKTALEIVKEVLDETLGAYGRSLDDSRLAATYPTREYCVQYGESNFDFVSRLLEEEGVAYWFQHDGEQEVMVLSDANSQFEEVAHQGGSGAIPFISRTGVVADDVEPVQEMIERTALTTTSIAVRDYDWTHPTLTIEASDSATDEQGRDREVFVFGQTTFGAYSVGSGYGEQDSDRRALIEAERVRSGQRAVVGESRVIGFSPGQSFSVEGNAQHPDLDGEYIIVRVDHSCRAGVDGGEAYHNVYEAWPMEWMWRPPHRHQRVRAASVESAVVVGPPGEEIHVDERGRIKVQFHWDREGSNNEQSSCWMRVMQPWAGAGWGHLWIPRIGMEVVVHFLDGDPDRPIVLGSLYTGENVPPYALPDDKTKSTIKSQSSPGGNGFNELRFEDKAGSEEIYLHAQKDLVEQVLHDHSTTVINNQTNKVGVDQTEDVKANSSMKVGANRTVHVKAAFDETIDAGETRKVTGGSTETITGGETRTISGGVDETINGGETRTVTGPKRETINGGMTRTIGATAKETITGALSQTITSGVTITTPQSYVINANATATVLAPAGALFLSPAGHKIVAVAGQTWIDSNYIRIGSLTKDAFTSKDVMSGFVGTLIGVQIRMMGIKLDIYPATAEVAPKAIKKGPQFDLTGMRIWKASIGRMTGAISVWLGG